MAAAPKNTRPASNTKGKKTAGGARAGSKVVQQPEDRVARTLWGVVVFGIGILMLASLIILDESKVLINFVREVQQGAAGFLCLVLPFWVCWIGITIAFTRPNPANAKRIACVFVLLVLVATCAQVFNLQDVMGVADFGQRPASYQQFIENMLAQSSKTPISGGVLGALLAWPLFHLLDVWGAIVLLIALILADLVILTGVSFNEVGDSVSERWNNMRDDMDERRARRELLREERVEAREQERMYAHQMNTRPAPDMASSDYDDGADEEWPPPPPPKREKARAARALQAAEDSPPPFLPEGEITAKPRRTTGANMADTLPPPPRKRNQPGRLYVETITPQPQAQPQVQSWPQDYEAQPAQEADVPPLVDFSARAQQRMRKPAGGFDAQQPRIARGGRSLYIETIGVDSMDDAQGAQNMYEDAGEAEETDAPAPWDAPLPMRESPIRQVQEDQFPWEEEPWDEAPWQDAAAPQPQPTEPAPWEDVCPIAPPRPAPVPPPIPEPAPEPAPRRLDQTPIALPMKEEEELLPDMPPYAYPPMRLLDMPKHPVAVDTRALDEANAAKLLGTLQSFGVQAKVLNVTHGPAITRYELQPAPGVKVSRIVSLVDDIALNMAAAGVRIEAPIPGKAAIGIEIPNESIATVVLREVLESDEVKKQSSSLACALGKDIAGRHIVADLARMPHVLIAGATGSGKSVCINTLISSLVFRSSPEEVRMILIDPKVVELSVYNGIPHLLVPVVTDPKKASGALSWAVAEMEGRYKKFADRGVRDIRGFNATLEDDEQMMPKIVVIIDELADLMMVAPGEVEESICRLAQLARAAGIHLVIATQRPSVNVITGVIKANIPSRIAFAVSSQVDSRTILDSAGAEKLLGKGDMLYAPQGAGKPIRVQGCFVSDEEVARVVDFAKGNRPAEYDEDVIEHLNSVTDNPSESASDGEEVLDDLLPQAIEIAMETGQASISMLQRRLRVGYARAGRLVDEMARRNIISQAEGAKPREVLMTREEWRRISEAE